jgi:hypothetical protein
LPEPAAIEDAVQPALAELGNAASGPAVAAHVQRVYGVRIDPKFLPVYPASILKRRRVERERAERRSAAVIATSNSTGISTWTSGSVGLAGRSEPNRLAAFGTALAVPDRSQRLDRVGELSRDLIVDHGPARSANCRRRAGAATGRDQDPSPAMGCPRPKPQG